MAIDRNELKKEGCGSHRIGDHGGGSRAVL